jgi:hypothetical protein
MNFRCLLLSLQGGVLIHIVLGVPLGTDTERSWRAFAAEPVPAANSLPAPVSGDSQTGVTNPFDDLVLQLVQDAVPREYEDRQRWGRTIEVVSGLDVRRDGLELRTKRRRKKVPHGRWQMYRVELRDPHRDLDIHLKNPRESERGMVFDLEATARLHTFARHAHWRYGVQLFSVSAEADARVWLRATCEVALQLDPKHLPPDVLVVPRVREAEIRLLELDLQRLSHLRGDLAQEIGRGLRRILNDTLAKRQEELTQRMNQQLEKRQDKFRLSLVDLATSRWKSILQRPARDEPVAEE